MRKIFITLNLGPDLSRKFLKTKVDSRKFLKTKQMVDRLETAPMLCFKDINPD
jgi:hypothetical protein